jgi:hypothetical protein
MSQPARDSHTLHRAKRVRRLVARLALLLPVGAACAGDGSEGSAVADTTPVAAAGASIGAVAGEIPTPIAMVGSVAELPNGKVVVVDDDERVLLLADFDGGSVTRLGAQGEGPREYGGMLGIAIPMPGDSVWIADYPNMRFIIVAPDGALTDRAVSLSPAMSPTVVAADSAGRMYWATRRAGADSQQIRRADPRTGQVETIGWIAVGQPQTRNVAESWSGTEGIAVTMVRMNPYQPEDAWGVLADGNVLIARARDYHAEVVQGGGRVITGPRVSVAETKVPEAERARYGFDVMPPFHPSSGARALTAPNGTLWLRRMTADTTRHMMDVFGANAQRLGEVTLPIGTRLVGLGRRYIYLTRAAGDSEILQRYRY